jgi:hypothetical protein
VAKVLAEAELDRYGAGDASGAWDLLDKSSQATVSRADYVAVHDACPLRALSYTIKSARMQTSAAETDIARLEKLGVCG